MPRGVASSGITAQTVLQKTRSIACLTGKSFGDNENTALLAGTLVADRMSHLLFQLITLEAATP